MVKRDRGLFNRKFMVNLFKIISVTGFTALAGFVAVQLFPLSKSDQGITIIGKLIFITFIVFGTHVLVSYLYDIREAKFVFEKLRRIIFRPIKL
jgi:hypothetical protein